MELCRTISEMGSRYGCDVEFSKDAEKLRGD